MDRFGDKVNCNPKVALVKKESFPLIDIDKITPGYKYVRSELTVEYTGQSGSKFQDHDILFARITPCLENGKVAIADTNGKNGLGSTELFVFRGISGISDTDYVYYLLRMNHIKQLAANSMTGASGRQRADLDFIKKIEWDFPIIEKQKQIAAILSSYDQLIETNNKRIKALEQMAENLYKEWFVRFRFPGHENAEFENGIPKGWEILRLGQVVDIIDGDRGSNYPKQEDFCSVGYCLFLNAGNVTKAGFDFLNCSFISKAKDESLNKGKLKQGDVVLTTRGTVGNAAYYNSKIQYSQVRINSGMVILRSNGFITPDYIYAVLKNGYFQTMMSLYSSGSAQPQLPIKDLRRIRIIIPDTKTMKRFSLLSQNINFECSILYKNIQNLIKQRDLLLPRLMSGKLEV